MVYTEFLKHIKANYYTENGAQIKTKLLSTASFSIPTSSLPPLPQHPQTHTHPHTHTHTCTHTHAHAHSHAHTHSHTHTHTHTHTGGILSGGSSQCHSHMASTSSSKSFHTANPSSRCSPPPTSLPVCQLPKASTPSRQGRCQHTTDGAEPPTSPPAPVLWRWWLEVEGGVLNRQELRKAGKRDHQRLLRCKDSKLLKAK